MVGGGIRTLLLICMRATTLSQKGLSQKGFIVYFAFRVCTSIMMMTFVIILIADEIIVNSARNQILIGGSKYTDTIVLIIIGLFNITLEMLVLCYIRKYMATIKEVVNGVSLENGSA
jgi:hypothetical protein